MCAHPLQPSEQRNVSRSSQDKTFCLGFNRSLTCFIKHSWLSRLRPCSVACQWRRMQSLPAIQLVVPTSDTRRQADTRRAGTQSLVVVILLVPAAATAMDRLTMLRSMTVATATTRAMATMDALAMVFPLSAA